MKRQGLSQELKTRIGTFCVNCGATEGLTYHHIVPLSLGGNDIESNMVCLCNKCHSLIHFGHAGVMCHGDMVKKGIRAAQAAGKHVGKPPADGEGIMQAIAEHSTSFAGGDWTEPEIMKALGIQRTTYCKFKRLLIQDIDGEWNHSFEKPTLVRRMPLYPRVILRQRNGA